MSLLEIPEASPGRVRIVFRHLISIDGQRQRSDLLDSLISPSSLPVRQADDDNSDVADETDRSRSTTPMLAKVLTACEKMGLIIREDGDVMLNPELPQPARALRTADKRLPLTLAELVFAQGNTANHELARLIAWYLIQDPLDPPSNERTVQDALNRTPTLADRFRLQNVSYGQFEDWVCYLGFAWGHPSPEKKRAITPDPTRYLRSVIGGFFETADAVLPLAALSDRLAQHCPVLEGGTLRREVEQLAGVHRDLNVLSSATSQAWLRLEQEGAVELVRKADAVNPVVLDDGGESVKVADVRRPRSKARARRRA